MSVLSIDLGTSNTVAVLAAHGRAPRIIEVEGSAAMPSAVFAAEDGQLVVGKEAERRARLDPARFEPNPKRRVDEGTLLLGDRVVPVTDAFAAVLRKVGDETSRQLGGARPEEVRLTHPAQWGPVRRNVLLSAARQAGLGTNLLLVPEPVAAAAHFASFPGRAPAPGQALAVYDLGAGTFDVAVVSGLVVLSESGLPDLGGLDVDQALLAHVGRQVSHRDPHGWRRLVMPQNTADRRAQRVLWEDVRAAKEALSGHPQTEVPLPDPFGDVLVTRTELEALIRPNLLRSVEVLDATTRSAGLTRERLAGVYLVGGSSRIPLVATLIAERLRIVPTNLDQPETAVALGAYHVSPEGTSLRTENLPGATPAGPDERTTSIAPPPRPPAVAGQPSLAPPAQPPASALGQRPHLVTAPAGPSVTARQPGPVTSRYSGPPPVGPASSGARRLPWVIGAAAAVVLVLVTVLVIVPAFDGGGGDSAATQPTVTTTPSSEDRPTKTTTATPTTTGTDDVVVGHPKVVNGKEDCAGLVTVADVGAAFAAPARPSSDGDPCYVFVDLPGSTDGSLVAVRVTTAAPYEGKKSAYQGNTAWEDSKAVPVVSSDGSVYDAPHCDVSLSLDLGQPDRAEHWLVAEFTSDRESRPTVPLCDALWTLTKTAFANLPDA